MIYLVILLAIAARFIPHMPNVAPVTALAIFAAAYLPKQQAIAIPLAIRFISDIFLGFFSWPLMVAVYASHLVGVLFGLWIKNSGEATGSGATDKWFKIIASSLGASIIFFLVTNFAFFYGNYAHNASGIIASYVSGLPFFRGTVLGDLGYCALLFGAYDLARAFIKVRQQSAIPEIV